MDEDDDGMRSFTHGQAQVTELEWVSAVREPVIGLGPWRRDQVIRAEG